MERPKTTFSSIPSQHNLGLRAAREMEEGEEGVEGCEGDGGGGGKTRKGRVEETVRERKVLRGVEGMSRQTITITP